MEKLLDAARAGTLAPLVLVRGDRILAEPLAGRLAAALGELWEVEPVLLHHPDEIGAVAGDLRTFSLFAPGKLVVAIETGVLADRDAAADLLAGAREVLPWNGLEAPAGKAREAALRLLRVLKLFDLDPTAGVESALGGLPDAVLAGGRGKGGKGVAAELRQGFVPLLEAALAAGLRGAGESEVTLLGDLLRDGLPPRHLLILVESAAADAHPLVASLARRRAVLEAGRLSSERGSVSGLDEVFAELARETGVKIRREAATELARRTLRTVEARRGPASGAVDADSTGRLAAEYRKLANLSGGGPIERELVEAQVEDRGEQDVWAILDAIGAGKPGEALAALGRRLGGAEDPVSERLAFFALLGGFVRHMIAVEGLLRATGAPSGVASYPRFRDQVAPRLQGAVPGLDKNPLQGMHAFRLHRAYLAAARHSPAALARMPELLLETELRLKGDSRDSDAALTDLVVRLAAPPPAPVRRASATGGGSRRRGAGGGKS